MIFDINLELENYRSKLNNLLALQELVEDSSMSSRDTEFANSLIGQFLDNRSLSVRQWTCVDDVVARYTTAEPIYGDFDAVHVMFRLASDKLKKPKIRLLSDAGVFVQLNFDNESRKVLIFRDGWQGHGKRKFIGWIKDNVIVPYKADSLDDDIKMVIQEFALNPEQVSKAMAHKLGACVYCGRRLSDPISKKVGFGKTCASHYGLKWAA